MTVCVAVESRLSLCVDEPLVRLSRALPACRCRGFGVCLSLHSLLVAGLSPAALGRTHGATHRLVCRGRCRQTLVSGARPIWQIVSTRMRPTAFVSARLLVWRDPTERNARGLRGTVDTHQTLLFELLRLELEEQVQVWAPEGDVLCEVLGG